MNNLKSSIKLNEDEYNLLRNVVNAISFGNIEMSAMDRLTVLRFYKSNVAKLTMIHESSLSMYYSEMISLTKALRLVYLTNDYADIVRNQLLSKIHKALHSCPIKISDSEITI